MDQPLTPTGETCFRRPCAPISVWVPLALIAAILVAACAGATITTDTRSFAERHGTVTQSTAL